MEKKSPILSIRPVFDQGLVTLQSVLFTAVAFILTTVIGGTIFFMLLHLIGLGRFVDASYIYGIFLIASIVLLPPLFFELKKRAYGRTVFHFFEDHVDYQYMHFYISLRRSRVRYREISDVRMEGHALQEQRRLTNIYITVPSMAQHPRAFAGIKIPDVPMSQDYLARILDMVESSDTRAMARAAGMMPAAAPVAEKPAAENPPTTPPATGA